MNKKIIRPIRQITAKFSKDNLAAYSAQSAFFLFISDLDITVFISKLEKLCNASARTRELKANFLGLSTRIPSFL